MRIARKQKVGVIYTPLDVSVKIVPYGGTTDRQVYNSATGGFYPDYEEGPLCLFPQCIAVNNRDTSVGDVETYINNSPNFTFSWYELAYNEQSKKYIRGNAIVSGQNGYEVVQNSEDGLVKGMLKVNKNASVGSPLRLEFEGIYADPDSGQVYRYVAQKNVVCDDMEESVPVLHVAPDCSVWNPVKESPVVKFEAMLTDGVLGDISSADNVRFNWYRKVNVQGTSYDLQPIDFTHVEDVDVVEMSQKKAIVDGKEVMVQGNYMIINRDLIGDGEMYVCKAMRRAALSSKDAYNGRDPFVELSCIRQMPAVDVKIIGMTNTNDSEQDFVNPRAVVSVADTVLSDEEVDKFYRLYWTVRKPGETEDKVVSNDINPTIPFVNGMVVGLGYEERGAQTLLTDDSGNLIVDDEGSVICAN